MEHQSSDLNGRINLIPQDDKNSADLQTNDTSENAVIDVPPYPPQPNDSDPISPDETENNSSTDQNGNGGGTKTDPTKPGNESGGGGSTTIDGKQLNLKYYYEHSWVRLLTGFLSFIALFINAYYIYNCAEYYAKYKDLKECGNDKNENDASNKSSSIRQIVDIISWYIKPRFYCETLQVYTPIILFLHCPLNITLLIYVFGHSPRFLPPSSNDKNYKKPSLIFESYLFYLCLLSEIISIVAQCTFAYQFLIKKGFGYIDNPNDWPALFASFLYVIVLFAVNDGAKCLAIVYINRFVESLTGNLLFLKHDEES